MATSDISRSSPVNNFSILAAKASAKARLVEGERQNAVKKQEEARAAFVPPPRLLPRLGFGLRPLTGWSQSEEDTHEKLMCWGGDRMAMQLLDSARCPRMVRSEGLKWPLTDTERKTLKAEFRDCGFLLECDSPDSDYCVVTVLGDGTKTGADFPHIQDPNLTVANHNAAWEMWKTKRLRSLKHQLAEKSLELFSSPYGELTLSCENGDRLLLDDLNSFFSSNSFHHRGTLHIVKVKFVWFDHEHVNKADTFSYHFSVSLSPFDSEL